MKKGSRHIVTVMLPASFFLCHALACQTSTPNIGNVAPCIAKQMPKTHALTIQRMTNVHFRPETIGCHLNIWLNIIQTRLTNGMPTTRIPAIYITMADNGEAGNTTLKVGNIEISAAPPPMATITAAKSRATNTTPNTNSSGLQMIANITRQILRNSPTTITRASPSFCRKVRGLSDLI